MADSDAGQQRRGAMPGQPVFIMQEGAERTQGRDAQQSNINAGKAIAESVRSTLGPKGMDKMLVNDGGDVTITNDGATILDEMDIEHPAAQMLVEVAESQEDEVGDGTTTAVILAGELLSEAEEFIDQDIHPRTIVEGYNQAGQIAQEAIDEVVLDDALDDDLLASVAATSMTGKGTGDVDAETLAEAVVEAVRRAEAEDGIDRDAISVTTRTGESAGATRVIDGVVVENDRTYESAGRALTDATVAVVEDMEVGTAETDAEYAIESPDQYDSVLEAENRELKEYADHLIDLGVDAVFVDGSVDRVTENRFERAGIMLFNAFEGDDIDKIARTTGARKLTKATDAEPDDLGHAHDVRVERFEGDEHVFVEGSGERTVTLFVRAGTGHVLDELERAIGDAVDVVVAALDAGGVVPGAGAVELAIADRLREEATAIEGREQLAVEAVADAFDAIPRTLAQNTGMDSIDALVDARARFEAEGRAGLVASGETGTIADPVEHGVLDPTAVKREAVRSAVEAASMIVRIDDVISAE
ncbi:MAG: thermosome subunit alpha [Halobacteriaceae archaeon]